MLDKDKLFDSFRRRAILADQENDYRGQYLLFIRSKLSHSHKVIGAVDIPIELLEKLFSSIRSQNDDDEVVTIGFIGAIDEVGILISWVLSNTASCIYVFDQNKKDGLNMTDSFRVNFQEDQANSKEELFVNLAFLQLQTRLEKIKDQLV